MHCNVFVYSFQFICALFRIHYKSVVHITCVYIFTNSVYLH